MDNKHKKILIVTSVEKELNAVKRGLNNDNRFQVVMGGVGPAAVAAFTAKLLSEKRFDLVINIGIAGGMNQSSISSIAVANEVIAADLGVETHDHFLPIEQLGFGPNSFLINEDLLAQVVKSLQNKKLDVSIGPILTVSTATGTDVLRDKRFNQYPGAIAEAMEGFGVASAASLFGIPFLEIRTISNLVGERQRKAWNIEAAIETIERVSQILKEVL